MTVLPRDHDWTVADLAGLPDDGLQYELADGVLLVSPAPALWHQRASGELYLSLRSACPPDLEVLYAPVDVQTSARRSLQPDLLVIRRGDAHAAAITVPPLLVVEILSPSTRAKDLLLKRGLYEDSGVPQYLLVDLDVPSLTLLRLTDGVYRDAAVAVGSQRLHLDEPFAVDLTPALLL